jgi:hypothetical protein
MYVLTAGGCKQIPLTAENSREAVRAASDFLHSLSVTPEREKP